MSWAKKPDGPDAKRLRGAAGVARRARWLAAHPLCVMCEAETPRRVTVGRIVDHVIPLSKGGADDESNLQTLCKRHDEIKTAADLGRRAPQRIGPDGWPVND